MAVKGLLVLCKYGHFIALVQPYTAPQVAQVVFAKFFKLHGLPTSIVCDRDPTFTSHFWKKLFHLNGIKFRFSSAYHPQTNEQTKVVNRTVEMYLRCFTSSNQNNGLNGFLGGSTATTPGFTRPPKGCHLR